MRSRTFSQIRPRDRLALGALAAAFAVVAGAALLADRAASAQEPPQAVWTGESLPVSPRPGSCCRWELLTPVSWERHWEALQQGGAVEAFPPVILLDQCSGRTWTLDYRTGPAGHDWRLLRRQGVD